MKTLIIAEKPSVAKDLAKAVGVPAKGEIYENDEFVISSAVGHVVELFDPEEYDPKFRRWSRKTLPIIPAKFRLRPSTEKGAKDQFLKLKRLMARKDVGTVVNGCDAGREGELIFSYIYELAGCRLPVKRLWLTSMTPKAMRDGIVHLRDGSEMANLRAAARSRAESDWLIGMNGTRAVTLRTVPAGSGAGKVATVGRVQTPTLSLIVQRELDIRTFEPKTFWQIVAEFGVAAGTYEGVFQREDFKKSAPAADVAAGTASDDRADRIWDEAQAEKIFAECKSCSSGTVTEEKKRKEEACPRLYDLTTLQREANKRFGFSASKTLRIAQALYEKYKATTYPRTDSRALPEDYIPTCAHTLGALGPTRFGAFASKVLENRWIRPSRRIFNNAEISDHFAIIPTDQPPSRALPPDESKIYEMVVRRFIAVFYPNSKFDVTTRFTTLAGTHRFKTEGRVLVEAGWREVYGREENSKDAPAIPPLADADRGNAAVRRVQLQKEATKPPTRYSEATLLAAMESAGKLVADEELADAMKERGLGTPATRAGIIEHLIRTKYVERAGRDLVPTVKAEQLIAFLKVAGVEYLTSPAMTGEWEYKLRRVSEGSLSREKFMDGIVALTQKIVESVNSGGSDDQWTETAVVSPTDSLPLLENYRMYRSQDARAVANGREFPALAVYKNVSGHNVTTDELAALVSAGEIGPFDDFKSRFGKNFSAKIKLEKNESGLLRSTLVFPSQEGNARSDEPADYANAPVVGVDPVTKCNVYETANGWSVNPAEVPAAAKKLRPFSMKKTLLGLEIPREQVEKLLRDGKTDLLRGFISNKTKRAFDAFLSLRSGGRLGWEFPPREAKPKTAAAGDAKTKEVTHVVRRSRLKNPDAESVKSAVPAEPKTRRSRGASHAASADDPGIIVR